MRCVHETLSAHIDGELSRDEHRSVKRHVARCSSCRVELARLQALKSLLQAVPTPVPSEELSGVITGRVRFREARRQRLRPKVRFWQGAFVGGVAAALIVGLSLLGVRLSGDDGHVFAATVEAVVSDHSRHSLLLEIGADDWAEWHLTWERQ